MWAVVRVGLFVEKARLRGRSCDWFAARDAYDAQHDEVGDGGAGDIDAIGVGIEVRRGEVQAVVKEGEQVVGDYALEGHAVAEAHFYPQAVELWAVQEGPAFGSEVHVEVADEIDCADACDWNFFVFAFWREEIERFGASETGWIEESAEGGPVVQFNDDFFVRRGWGSRLQVKAPLIGQEIVAEARTFMLC